MLGVGLQCADCPRSEVRPIQRCQLDLERDDQQTEFIVSEASGGIVTDHLLDQRLILRQPARGHKAGTDALLLAAAAPRGAKHVLDVGAGVGTIGLVLAKLDPIPQITLIERDQDLALLAAENIKLNQSEDRVTIHAADFLEPNMRRQAGLSQNQFDLILCNPPFYDQASHRSSPDRKRAAAHMMQQDDQGSLIAPWLRAFASVLTPSGSFVMIHRPEVLGDLITQCEGRFGALTLRPIHPRADQATNRILIHATKGSKAPLRLLPGIHLHDTVGAFTPLAQAIHKGHASLDW